MADVLRIEDLIVRYRVHRSSGGITYGKRDVEAVAGVSLSVAESETFALVGESGSGKTSIAMAVAGLAPVSDGRVVIDGTDVTNLPPKRAIALRRRVALLFQDAVGSLSPRLSIRALISEALAVRDVPKSDWKSEGRRLINLVGLHTDILDRFPHQLSGGQARRVGIARALALDPRIILADEPTAGLDVSIQGEVINLLVRLQGEFGLSILLISHNLNVVRLVAQRIGIMYLGRIVEHGDAAAVFKHPTHPYTHGLLAANLAADPDIEWRGPEVRGDVPSLLDRPRGCEFHPRCSWATDRCMREVPAHVIGLAGQSATCHHPLDKKQVADRALARGLVQAAED